MTFLPRLGPQVGAAERGAPAAHSERYEGHPTPTSAAGGVTGSAAARLGTASAADEASFELAGLGARAGKDVGEEAREDVMSDEPGAPLRGEAGGQLALRVTEGSSVGAAHRGAPSFAAELAENVSTASRAADKPRADTATGPQPAPQAELAHAEALPTGARPTAVRSTEPATEGDEPVVVAVARASSTLPEASWAPEAPRAVGASGSFAASSPATPSARATDSDLLARPPVALDSDGGSVRPLQMISRADESPSHMSERFEVRAVMGDRLAQAEVVDHPATDTIALGEGTSKSVAVVTMGPGPASPESLGHAPSGAAPREPTPAREVLPLPGAEELAPLVSASSPRAGVTPWTSGVVARPERSGPGPAVVAAGGSPSVRSAPPVSITVGESPERRAAGFPVAFARAGAVYARAASDASAAVASPLQSRSPSESRSPLQAPLAPRPESERSKSVVVAGPIDGAKAAHELPAVARLAPPPADFPVARRGVAARHSALTSLTTPTAGRAVPASPAAVQTQAPTPTSALAAPARDVRRSPVTAAAAPFLPRLGAEPRSSVPSGEAPHPAAVSRAIFGGLQVPAVGAGPWLESERAETGAAGTDSSSPSDAPPVRPASERNRHASEPSQASQHDGGHAPLVAGEVTVTAPPVVVPSPRSDLSPPPVAGGDMVVPLTSALTDAEPIAPVPGMSSPVPPRVDVALEVVATPQRPGSSMPTRAGVAARADVSQRGSAQTAPAVFEPAASPVSKVGAEPPLVAPQVVSGSFAPLAFASAPHAPGAGAVAEATAAHPTPLVVSSSATPPTSRLSDTRRVRAAHLDLAQQSSRSGTVATSPSTKVVGTPAAVDKGELAISGGRPTAVDPVVPRALSGLVDRLAARSNPEPAREERPSTPGPRPVRAAQTGATANAFVPTSAATLPAFAPAFAFAAPSAREPKVTGGASASDAGASREVQTAKPAKTAATIADLAEGGPSSGSRSARADEPRTERREATPIVVSPPQPAQAQTVAPSGHSAPGALPAPVTVPPALLPPPTAPARPLYDMATSDQSLQATALGRNAHVHLDTGAAGALSLHLTVRDGVADLEIDGPAVEALDLRPEDIRRALAGEGLALGHFASRVNEAAEVPASRAPTNEATARTAASEAQRPAASDAAPPVPMAGFPSHQSGASSYGEGRNHWHDDRADAGGPDGRSPPSSGSSQSSSTSTSEDISPRRRRGFHVTA